jgi:V/A-type H+-transporting ATPase subunit D
MALSFQYNKTALQALEKQLKVRERALPVLKNKEAALRLEVKRAKDYLAELDKKIGAVMVLRDSMSRLWCEFDASFVTVGEVRVGTKKIAGIKTPVLESVRFGGNPINLVVMPVWMPQGIAVLRELSLLAIEHNIIRQKMGLLDFARKKTTQKVNLYEKVQIPDYHDAIRKIKRFVEDEENLAKSAQKILKNRLIQMEDER